MQEENSALVLKLRLKVTHITPTAGHVGESKLNPTMHSEGEANVVNCTNDHHNLQS